MTTCRLVYKSRTRSGTILAYSSEHPQFPVENIQDDLQVLPWRSRYGTGTGNGRFVVAATNKYIDFDEGGAELTATITPGTYNGQTLATEVKTQLDSAGGTYTVAYSESTGKFTIARAAGNFTIRWQSGTNTANCAAGLLGYSKVANDTGTNTYTSDTAVIHTSEEIDFDFGAAYEYNSIALLNHNLSSAAVVTIYGADDSAFTSNVVSDVQTYNANNIYAFISTARTKRYCRLHIVDVANPSGYVQVGVLVVGKYLQPNRNFGPYGEGEVDESEMEYSPSNNVFVVQERPALVNREYSFKGLDATTIAEVRLLLAECGIRKAFWICTDTTAPNSNSAWVKLKETSLPRYENYEYWIWDMPVEQVL
jgi:hypothetical protein